ncbi:hypothetical protein BDW72DRAFT_181553 [Aspergillus terricola var. indicus]
MWSWVELHCLEFKPPPATLDSITAMLFTRCQPSEGLAEQQAARRVHCQQSLRSSRLSRYRQFILLT